MSGVIEGDCLCVMRDLPGGSVDAIVTDPPYGLKFMGREWDHGVPGHPFWAEALRVAKPGAHLVAFGGTRTFHRLACGIEDAGWEIRDVLTWLYGSGFPKSLDVAKAIDRQRHDRPDVYRVTAWVRAARDEAGLTNRQIDDAFGFNGMAGHWTTDKSQPAVPTLEQVPKLLEVLGNPEVPEEIGRLLVDLNGPKGEPGKAWFRREVVGRARGGIVPDPDRDDRHTVGGHNREFDLTAPARDEAKAWAGWGTALKPAWEPIILARKPLDGTVAANVLEHGTGGINVDGCRVAMSRADAETIRNAGGFMRAGYDVKPGHALNISVNPPPTIDAKPHPLGRWPANVIVDEAAAAMLDEQSPAGPSRFFYCPKANKRDRGDGNKHPTVKPTELMRWLCRLVTPPGGLILDPFAGSGSTGKAAVLEGFRFMGIEREPEYVEIARRRLEAAERACEEVQRAE